MVLTAKTLSNVNQNRVAVCDRNECLGDSSTDLMTLKQRSVGTQKSPPTVPVTKQSLDCMTDMLFKVWDFLTTRKQHQPPIPHPAMPLVNTKAVAFAKIFMLQSQTVVFWAS